ncbi:GNAT family N-acetyltransferase [Neobacillus massiliamazoniensis]|uniref:GNAT family acetyltransferase n=1 Tax=Neobacillus massiliamazoniensis TaxID=1499688 RepID=A0A0U1NVP2_9BACI|nr:GNAT family N-acetyltransferase [Neobacillus massiliamazoniensis]CRK82089.1 GNAT family acetyltransferase [Neobacillus massiliamazoniensis]
MFTRLDPNDAAIGAGTSFFSDEVQYNLIHLISESNDSLCLKTFDGKMIFAQTPGHNGWLWISREVAKVERKSMIEELAIHLKGVSLPGISSEPEITAMFAEVFSNRNGIPFYSDMTLEAYHCPKVIKPVNVTGKLQKATQQNVVVIAEYLAGFLNDALGTKVEPNTQLDKAKTMVDAGGLYHWMVDDQPVSMANISHRSPRHARINTVYTPDEHRKKGYASALVAELCCIIETEKLVPMLYADIKNPTSNKVYQNIGFLKKGKIAEIKFSTSS